MTRRREKAEHFSTNYYYQNQTKRGRNDDSEEMG
jgi:hypothetical protein